MGANPTIFFGKISEILCLYFHLSLEYFPKVQVVKIRPKWQHCIYYICQSSILFQNLYIYCLGTLPSERVSRYGPNFEEIDPIFFYCPIIAYILGSYHALTLNPDFWVDLRGDMNINMNMRISI